MKKIHSALLMLLLLYPPMVGAGQEEARKIFESVKPTSVVILVNGVHSGSGNIVSPQGLVLTAGHIFGSSAVPELEVFSESLGRRSARMLEISRVLDLALLKIDEDDLDLPFLESRDTMPEAGSDAYILSAPGYLHNTLVRGLVGSDRAYYRKGAYASCEGYTEVIHISALLDRGSSGGAWVDSEGRIVGVQSGWVDALGASGRSAGINLVSPTCATAEFIATRQAPERAWLGGIVEELWSQSRGFVARFPRRVSGLAIHDIKDDGPLAAAGAEREQLITAVDGNKVDTLHGFLDYLRARSPGDEVVLTMLMPDSHELIEKRLVLGTVK